MNVDPYYIVLAISLLVVFSYVFDWIAKKTNFPSIFLLLGVGIALRPISEYYGLLNIDVTQILNVFGIMGLIMIVLEGALDLEINKSKIKIIYSSLLSAFIILLATAFLVSFIIYEVTDEDFMICFVNAIPFSVVSSAITIPSVVNLNVHKKEFLTYESTFSDILGIMLFNFVVVNEVINWGVVAGFFGELLILLLISVVSTFALMYFLAAIKAHHKFFMIFAILITIYSIGKMAHLSTLILILFFGIVLNNYKLLKKINFFNISKYLNFPKLDVELKLLKSVTAEVAFLIRTIFFVLFGYSFDFSLLDTTTIWCTNIFPPLVSRFLPLQMIPVSEVWIIGLLIVVAVMIIRFIYLKFSVKSSIFPEVFIAPRGLITILLFFSIPSDKIIGDLGQGLLFFVIIFSNIVMMLGLMFSKKNNNNYTVASIEKARNDNELFDYIKQSITKNNQNDENAEEEDNLSGLS